MATKQYQDCPKCGTSTFPTDEPVRVPTYGSMVEYAFARFQRYECTACGNVFADKCQRERNASRYAKIQKNADERPSIYG